MASKKRLDWVDYLRALAMVLVVYGHQVPYLKGYFVFTSPIKLPLFFAITAFVFNEESDFKYFITKMIRQIMIPWLVLTIIPRIIIIPYKGISWFSVQVLNIITGKAYWYMPCLIVAEILWFFIIHAGKNYWLVYILSFLSFIAGILANRYGILRMFMIDTALTSELFFVIGYFYRHHIENYSALDKNIKRILLISGVSVYIVLGFISILVYGGECIDVHLVKYYSFPLCLVMVFVGVLCLFIFADGYLSSQQIKWLSFIGRNTLVTYILHTALIKILTMCLSKLTGKPNNPAIAILFTVISVMVSCYMSKILHMIAPFAFGANAKHSKKV